MKTINYANAIMFLAVLNACSSVPDSKINAIEQMSESTTYSYICDVSNNGKTTCASEDPKYYKNAYKHETTCPLKKEVRNRIISEQMGLIDDEYRDNVENLENSVDYKNFAVHITSLGLSTAATLTGTASVKAIIAAIDTGLKGTNTNFDSDVLHNKALNIIKNQMIKDRKNSEISLKAKMIDDKCEYSLEEATVDLSNYRNAGTFDSALTSLESEVGGAAQSQSIIADKLAAGTPAAVKAAENLTKNVIGTDNSVTNSVGTAALAASATGSKSAVVTATVNAATAAAVTGASPAETEAGVTAAARQAGASATDADTIGKAAAGTR
jgi:hypothetical protein